MENYRATLAHKINHNFHYNCTEWFFQHPRHGLIPSIIATSDLKQGQELYLHYGNERMNSGMISDKYINFISLKVTTQEIVQIGTEKSWTVSWLKTLTLNWRRLQIPRDW